MRSIESKYELRTDSIMFQLVSRSSSSVVSILLKQKTDNGSLVNSVNSIGILDSTCWRIQLYTLIFRNTDIT